MRIRTRPLEERDLGEADRIMRLAFGTFFGLPDPMTMFGDSDIAYTRFRAAPDSALAAEADSRLVGSNFITQWGSFGFFGPLSVEPRRWDQGVAQRLLEPTMELFEKWGCRHAGLFTFSHSPKHIASIKSSASGRSFLRGDVEAGCSVNLSTRLHAILRTSRRSQGGSPGRML
jgi:GNAT superfamily N-acetyltransferase